MDMKIIKIERCLCTCCMEEHEVKTVLVDEHSVFKDREVAYTAEYLYCDIADELYMDEKQIKDNDIRLKDAYRIAAGLLTSKEIADIRSRYCISQSDLCTLLGWGGKTITRYESHQVQDKAHDTILRKLAQDPEWFLELLYSARISLPCDSYTRYLNTANMLYEQERDLYLRKSIEADYVQYQDNMLLNGNSRLSLDKVVDIIRYYAASKKITRLYKVKLMKLMWYADYLSYKNRGFAITGLVYQALPMGAVPIGYNSIINLNNVPCEEVDMGDSNAYYFHLDSEESFPSLENDDRQILDEVIERLGDMSRTEIVNFMHREKAYTNTQPRDIISYDYAKDLNI